MSKVRIGHMFAAGLMTSAFVGGASANMFSEFEPNPAGGDPAMVSVELSGTAGEMFDLFILSIENDGFNGTVDRSTNVTGTYDANGLAVVTVGDFENPTFTNILTDAFTGSVGDDLDADDDGNLEIGSLGTILDVVGISDATADNSVLYSNTLLLTESSTLGTSILFNGQFDPLTVFRSGSTGEFFQTVTVDFGQDTERLGVFTAGGVEIDAALFDASPFGTTFGEINPIIPEPTSLALLGLGGIAMLTRRRSQA